MNFMFETLLNEARITTSAPPIRARIAGAARRNGVLYVIRENRLATTSGLNVMRATSESNPCLRNMPVSLPIQGMA